MKFSHSPHYLYKENDNKKRRKREDDAGYITYYKNEMKGWEKKGEANTRRGQNQTNRETIR